MFNVLITAYTAAPTNQTVGLSPFLWWGNPKCKKLKELSLYGFDSIERHIDFGGQERSGDQELSISGHWEVNYPSTLGNVSEPTLPKKGPPKKSLDVGTGHWWRY